jgi:NAD dependent epimerase/dehydratase family enzyme
MADELLLSSTRVKPGKLLAAGYPFHHVDLSGALAHLLNK